MDYYGWQQTPLDFILLGWLLLPIQSFQDLSNFVDKGWGSVWRPCYGCRRTVTMWYSFHWRKRCPDYTYNGISRKLMIFFFFYIQMNESSLVSDDFSHLKTYNLFVVRVQSQFSFSFHFGKIKKKRRKEKISYQQSISSEISCSY